MPTAAFLDGHPLRQVRLPASCPFQPVGLALGKGASGLEVLVTQSLASLRVPAVRSAWRERHGGRAAPLVLVVLHDGKATLCGPAGDDPPVYVGVDLGQAERLCREALQQPDRHAALRLLRDALPAVEFRLPGLRNEGLLATHELEYGVRHSPRWQQLWPDADAKARHVLGQHGEELLRGLGFQIEPCDGVTSVLRAGQGGHKVAVAVLLEEFEAFELQGDRFAGLSPVSYALTVADHENVPYVVISQGRRLRLYPTQVGVGVGRRGRTETYVELHTALLPDTDAAYLWLLFSADALVPGGTLAALLQESQRFAGRLAEQLRERIYERVIPDLAKGLAEARGLARPTAQQLADTYEMAMTVLFRLLFIAYGEDKDLLPYRGNQLYRDRSLKKKANELLRLHHDGTEFDAGDSLWAEVCRLFRAVEEGHREWGVPAYDGGLFSRDPEVSPAGALLDGLSLPNTIMGPVLHHLLLIGTPEGLGPVDFRSLGVREFGTIYEGLLESELAVAETDLALDSNGFYRPARSDEEPVVRRRHIYLHNRSGARKATGTYFTKPFAVEHLLEHALEPALQEHLKRLDALKDDDEAAEAFFDFRVADIAMGSGHFLVAAIDRIERAFSRSLSKRPLGGVRHELARLRESAREALGPLAETVAEQIEDSQLLRRLIARRSIYGVDLNPVAVNLARLSIWIHTFVPGLPLSLLDRNLVCGNSLVGIGRIDEIEQKARQDHPDAERRGDRWQRLMLGLNAERLVGDALEPLQRLARAADATAAELSRARRAMHEAAEACRPAEALCDIVTACRMERRPLDVDVEEWESLKERIVDSRPHKAARKALANLKPLHFPVAFPEVFLRKRGGFDVILGNPPWEKAHVEEHEFWCRHVPGLRGVSQRERERLYEHLRKERVDLVAAFEAERKLANGTRAALLTGPFPGMGSGHPDLYKAFCWRFWHLVAPEGGWIGVVLPRSAWNAKGSTEFRTEVFKDAGALDLTMLVNNRQWVFPEVHPQYSIGLTGIRRGKSNAKNAKLRGPFASLERFEQGVKRPPAQFAADEVMGWTDTASLPLLPTEESLEIFAQMRRAPRLDLNDGRRWRARPIQGDLNATNDKGLMDLESESRPRGYWPVYKGESFDLWEPDTGRYYAWADPKEVIAHLLSKRRRAARNRKSPFSEFDQGWLRDPKTLPCHFARIAFRDVTRATDSRTVRVALVPPKVFVNHKAPYFL